MVTKSETTEILTQPKLEEVTRPSIKRWLKHFFYMPAAKRYFNKQDQQAIAHAVEQAEQGHAGEIQVVIEGHIPAHQAYFQDTRARAQQLFAELGVWDTEFNSGVLLYLLRNHRKAQVAVWALYSFLWDFVLVYLQLRGQPGFELSQMFTTYYEWFGVAAAVLMLAYNGMRGSGHKQLFYWSYPAHVYLLYGASCLVYRLIA